LESRILMEIKKTSRRILVIDDEAVLKIVEEVLTNLRHNMIVCSSPKAGLSRFRKENFDIVITNLNMPEMNGWEVAEKIKKAKATIPIILLME